MTAHLRYEVRNGIALLTLNRPDQLNALTYEMLLAFREAIDAAVADDAVTAIAVTGEGRAFCAGIDLSLLQRSAARGTSEEADNKSVREGDLPALFSFLLRVPKPLIAAVNGVAAGGGFVLAMMCDLRFASDAASFVTVFSKRGLIAEHGMSWLLPRQIGTSRALDLLWSSRKVAPDEALRIGLVDRVTPPEGLIGAIEAYAADLRANIPPRTIAVIKRQVYDHLSVDLPTAAADCAQLMDVALAHPDALEGANSFLERRAPRFQPLGGAVS